MMSRYLIGVDLGTSSTKAALYTTAGTLVAEAGAGGSVVLSQAWRGRTRKR